MGQAKQGQGERKDEWWILKEKTNIVLKQKGIREFMMNINGAACVHDTPSLEWTLRSTASDFLYLFLLSFFSQPTAAKGFIALFVQY